MGKQDMKNGVSTVVKQMHLMSAGPKQEKWPKNLFNLWYKNHKWNLAKNRLEENHLCHRSLSETQND